MCAPISEPFSRTHTLTSWPCSAESCRSRIAAARPAGPPPTTTTSNSMLSRSIVSPRRLYLGPRRRAGAPGPAGALHPARDGQEGGPDSAEGQRLDRKSVAKGKSGSVQVDIGGSRTHQKNRHKKN